MGGAGDVNVDGRPDVIVVVPLPGKDDSAAVKQTQGLTWTARNANAAGAPEISFDYGQANDLPLAWRR